MIPNFDSQPEPRGELDEKSLKNWQRIPPERRQACLEVLRKKTPPAMLRAWQEQHKAGMRIGSDDLRFHFDIGMQVRNALRDVLLDKDLPDVEYPGGKSYRNWDDFYMGALQEFVAGA